VTFGIATALGFCNDKTRLYDYILYEYMMLYVFVYHNQDFLFVCGIFEQTFDNQEQVEAAMESSSSSDSSSDTDSDDSSGEVALLYVTSYWTI
jgi:hypothetical protein